MFNLLKILSYQPITLAQTITKILFYRCFLNFIFVCLILIKILLFYSIDLLLPTRAELEPFGAIVGMFWHDVSK